MNPLQRKAKTVEMTKSTDHRDVSGGLGRRLWRPRLLPYVALVAVVAAIPVATGSAAGSALPKPTGLKTFQLRLNDSLRRPGQLRPFSRTPAFAWAPVRRATRYEFELSTSKGFTAGNGLVWSSKSLTMPTASVPISLPWSTGAPASFHWHVRAAHGRTVSAWSEPNRFTMGWDSRSLDRGVPHPMQSEPGFVQWSKVDGASGYQIWFTNSPKPRIVSTITNVADFREYYGARAPGSRVEWRVRALRRVYGVAQNGLPALLYGTWSAKYDSELPAIPPPAIHPVPRYAVSDTTSFGTIVGQHELVPAFVFSTGDGYELHRVYVATDENCVNVVHISPAVGGNVYAPRSTGGDAESFNMYDLTPAKASEAVPATPVGGAGASGASLIPADFLQQRAAVDLWDSNWSTGRYYWTVVPVGHNGDAELAQDACQAGRRGEFGKTSVKPDLAEGLVPFATGLSTTGRLFSAASSRAQFLRRIARNVEAGSGRSRVRRPVEPRRARVENGRSAQNLFYVGHPSSEAGHMAVSHTRYQRLAAREPGDELDDLTGQAPHRGADLQGRQGLATVASAPGIRGRLRSRRAVDRDDRDGRRDHGSRRRPQLRHGDAAAGRRRVHGCGSRRQADGGLPRAAELRDLTSTCDDSGERCRTATDLLREHACKPGAVTDRHLPRRSTAACSRPTAPSDDRPADASPAPTIVRTTWTRTSSPRRTPGAAKKVTLVVHDPDNTKTLIRETSTFTPPTGCNNGTHGPVSAGC